jgi:hypothetical protein
MRIESTGHAIAVPLLHNNALYLLCGDHAVLQRGSRLQVRSELEVNVYLHQ